MSFLNTKNLPTGYHIVVELVDAFKSGEILYLITNQHEQLTHSGTNE
ncbi:hypothetical protein [Thalassomonas haliotis]|uniref:Transposase n=1 Tax=Thalassomonas haliotis TaxID=485448 RepID=A0ABY7VA02_9GAMM|nr:hypothetical protein [Thalassomonas haliotis]WDE09743.1 hypothetical protein H3N35_15605 [Thalassomonas haliotis]